jgi:hypothetical protein
LPDGGILLAAGRLRLCKFRITFSGLSVTILGEASGATSRILEGLRKWQESGPEDKEA